MNKREIFKIVLSMLHYYFNLYCSSTYSYANFKNLFS